MAGGDVDWQEFFIVNDSGYTELAHYRDGHDTGHFVTFISVGYTLHDLMQEAQAHQCED